MKLYYFLGACSLAPHIVLNELGISYELEKVDPKTGTYRGGDFKKINPKGYVPVLELDNGERLTEAAIVLQYLADQKPEKKLIPAFGTMERYRCLEWLNFISTEFHKGFGPLFHPAPEEYRIDTKKRLAERFSLIAPEFRNRDYVLPSGFSVCDAYLFTVLNWTGFLKIDLTPWPELQAYLARMRERPSVVAAMEEEKAEGR